MNIKTAAGRPVHLAIFGLIAGLTIGVAEATAKESGVIRIKSEDLEALEKKVAAFRDAIERQDIDALDRATADAAKRWKAKRSAGASSEAVLAEVEYVVATLNAMNVRRTELLNLLGGIDASLLDPEFLAGASKDSRASKAPLDAIARLERRARNTPNFFDGLDPRVVRQIKGVFVNGRLLARGGGVAANHAKAVARVLTDVLANIRDLMRMSALAESRLTATRLSLGVENLRAVASPRGGVVHPDLGLLLASPVFPPSTSDYGHDDHHDEEEREDLSEIIYDNLDSP